MAKMTVQVSQKFGIDLAGADDMTKQWPKSDLLLALGFPTSARYNLCRWYWEKQDSITLAEVFELVISSDRDPRPGYLISKMLDVRCVGRKTFIRVVNHMAGLDFGEKCNLVWNRKYMRFLDAHRAKASRPYSWSFPITGEGMMLAKFRNGSPHTPRRRKSTANR